MVGDVLDEPLEATDGRSHTLRRLGTGSRVLVVVFTSAQCPYARAYFERNIGTNP